MSRHIDKLSESKSVSNFDFWVHLFFATRTIVEKGFVVRNDGVEWVWYGNRRAPPYIEESASREGESGCNKDA